MKLWPILLGSLFLGVTACASSMAYGIQPVDPKVGNPRNPPSVASLQPTLRWEPERGSHVTYDLIIFEAVEIKPRWGGARWAPGEAVYFREGVKKPEHRVEQSLMRKAVYFWSIRTRRGDTVSEWSRYDYRRDRVKEAIPFFMFQTPTN